MKQQTQSRVYAPRVVDFCYLLIYWSLRTCRGGEVRTPQHLVWLALNFANGILFLFVALIGHAKISLCTKKDDVVAQTNVVDFVA